MNLTLSVAEDVVQRARDIARQRGTSLNAMIRAYLEDLAGPRRGETLADQFDTMWGQRAGHSGGQRFRRDDLYEERLSRGRSV
jgi:hypothetical protein